MATTNLWVLSSQLVSEGPSHHIECLGVDSLPISWVCLSLILRPSALFESERGRRRSVAPVQSTDLVPPASSPGCLKKGAFDETLSTEPLLLGLNPHRNRPVFLSHKTVSHTAIYGSQKEDGSTPTPRARQHFTARWPLSKLTTLLMTSEPTPMLDPFALPGSLYW